MPDAMRELREEGRKRAAEFTWTRAAEQTLKIVDDVTGVSYDKPV